MRREAWVRLPRDERKSSVFVAPMAISIITIIVIVLIVLLVLALLGRTRL